MKIHWYDAELDLLFPFPSKPANKYDLHSRLHYDIVIFDCEFDLKYLNQLIDTDIDTAIIVANPTEASAHLAKRIEEFSAKYAAGGQLGVVINKIENNDLTEVYTLLKKYDLEVLGVIPYDNKLIENTVKKESEIVQEAIKQFYFRLNLPQAKV